MTKRDRERLLTRTFALLNVFGWRHTKLCARLQEYFRIVDCFHATQEGNPDLVERCLKELWSVA